MAQSIADSTVVALAFDTERYDTDTIHDTATNNSRLTCKTAGKYLINFQGNFAANGTGQRIGQIRRNGTSVIAEDRRGPDATIARYLHVTTIYDLAVNDYVEAIVWQNSTVALNFNKDADHSPEFMMQRIG